MCGIALCFAVAYAASHCALGCRRGFSQEINRGSDATDTSSSGPGPSKLVQVIHSVLAYLVAPVALCGAANSLGVLATSQMFLGWNFTQGIVTNDTKQRYNKQTSEQKAEHQAEHQAEQHMEAPRNDDKLKLGLSLPFADAVFQDNFIAHIAPALAAFVLLLLLATGRNGPNVNRWFVVVASFVCMLLFLILYMCVPAEDEKGKKYVWFAKINYVYNNPQPWMFAAQLVLTTLALVIVPSCLLSRKVPWVTACHRLRATDASSLTTKLTKLKNLSNLNQ